MEEPEERRHGTAFERHFQSALTSIAVVLLVWVGYTLTMSREEIVRLQEKVSAMQKQLDIVNSMERRINSLELRVGILENKTKVIP